MSVIPIVRDDSSRFTYDIYSRLLQDRIVWLDTEIGDYVSRLICTQILYLEAEGQQLDASDRAIKLYINSPGGSVMDGLAIYDIMQYVSCPVYTYCVGMCASMASVLLAAGEKGHRYIFENAEVMIHQVLGGIPYDQASNVLRSAEHMAHLKQKMNNILSKHTGQKVSKIEKDTDRDYYLQAEEAVKYGLVDEVVNPPSSTK